MYSVQFHEDAKVDYIKIGQYIANDNLYYANEVLNKIDKSIETICLFPFIGKDMGNNNRLIVEPTYKFKIVYKVKGKNIRIISVFKYKNLFS